MESDGTLMRIEPNRNGEYVFPKGCKRVKNSAIILRAEDSKIVLGDTNILFEKNFAVYDLPEAYVTEANMELDLKGSRYTSIYSLINALDSLNVRGESFLYVHYVFDEKLITEQILSILCANKAGMRLYVQTTRTRIVARIGRTNVVSLFGNAKIFKQIYAEIMRFYNSSDKMKEILKEAVKGFETFNDFVYKGAVKV
jgi:hypothetical protein